MFKLVDILPEHGKEEEQKHLQGNIPERTW